MWAVGIDLGGTKIEVAAVDEKGKILERLKFPTESRGDPEATETAIIEAVKRLKKPSPPVGLGIGVAGQISLKDGSVIFAPNLEWSDVPLQKSLSEALCLPVVVTNDVRAATWGEWLHGAGRGCDHLVCLFVGTGIGGGVVSEGHMLEGCGNTAGELGHMVVDLHGPPCHCGSIGCIEAIAGGRSLSQHAQEQVTEESELWRLAGGDPTNITTRLIIEAHQLDDPLAHRLLDEAAEALTVGCANIANSLNPCRLILGGGVIEGCPELVSRVRNNIGKYALDAAIAPLEVRHAELHNEAGTIGAAALAISKFA